MRLLYHHRTLGDGAEGIHVAAMVSAFRAIGHTVDVVALIGEQTNVDTPRTRRLQRLRKLVPQKVYGLAELAYNVVGLQALRRAIARSRPDVIYERYILFNAAGLTAARWAGIPLILEVNAPLAYERAAYEQLSMTRLARTFEQYVCRRADLVVVVSTPLKEYLIAEGVRPDRILVLPNGTDPDRFHPDAEARRATRVRYGIPDAAVVVGFTGIVRPWHGPDLLVKAFARTVQQLPGSDLRLLIVGDGPSRADIETLASENGVRDRLVITGRVPYDDIPAHVAAFDIGVSPRATFYASPMKVPEYMATGIAVIAPDASNLRDLITNETDGLLFEPDNADALSNALTRLASHADLRLAIARTGRASILNGRTWTHVARRAISGLEDARAAHA